MLWRKLICQWAACTTLWCFSSGCFQVAVPCLDRSIIPAVIRSLLFNFGVAHVGGAAQLQTGVLFLWNCLSYLLNANCIFARLFGPEPHQVSAVRPVNKLSLRLQPLHRAGVPGRDKERHLCDVPGKEQRRQVGTARTLTSWQLWALLTSVPTNSIASKGIIQRHPLILPNTSALPS